MAQAWGRGLGSNSSLRIIRIKVLNLTSHISLSSETFCVKVIGLCGSKTPKKCINVNVERSDKQVGTGNARCGLIDSLLG